jgi:hypothetical protein
LNFVKDFSWFYWDNHVIFVLPCIYLMDYIYWFAYVDLHLYPWNETVLIIEYDLFKLSFYWVFYWEFLYLCSLKRCNSLFLLGLA